MDRPTVLTLLRLGAVILVMAAIVAQAVVLADAGAFDPTRFFAFFTIQSNLVGVAAFLWYPYPFLDPANGGYGQVAIVVVGVLVGFIGISAAILAIGNARSRGQTTG